MSSPGATPAPGGFGVCAAQRPRARRKAERGTKRPYSACKIPGTFHRKLRGARAGTAERRGQNGVRMVGGQKIPRLPSLSSRHRGWRRDAVRVAGAAGLSLVVGGHNSFSLTACCCHRVLKRPAFSRDWVLEVVPSLLLLLSPSSTHRYFKRPFFPFSFSSAFPLFNLFQVWAALLGASAQKRCRGRARALRRHRVLLGWRCRQSPARVQRAEAVSEISREGERSETRGTRHRELGQRGGITGNTC